MPREDLVTPLGRLRLLLKGAARRTAEAARRTARAGRRVGERPLVRRASRWTAIVLVAGFGAWLGIAVSGGVHSSLGPVEVGMSLRPAWDGQTVVDVNPLGTLLFDSHDAPLRLRVTLENIDQEQARAMIEDPRLADRLPELIEQDLRAGVTELVIRSALFSLAGALLAGLIVFRRVRVAMATLMVATVCVVGTGTLAAATFRPQSLIEPRYTGLLTGAPSLVGSAESIVTRFESYRAQLTKLVSNVSQLYDTVSALPVYDGDPNSIRVLHVSDIHINPIAWNLIKTVTSQFKIDMIVDTGDLTDHGSKPEDNFVKEIGKLDVPYVWVRGNHDSKGTQRAVAKQRNAVVLDGRTAEVGGLTIYGIGDPRFTPDLSAKSNSDPTFLRGFGQTRDVGKKPVDFIAVHDPIIAEGFSGRAPAVLAGHAHARSSKLLPSGTRVLIQGSTGGAGLRALEHEEPTPVMASVLYFDKETRRLEAWDDITMGGLGQQSVQIQRHVEERPQRTIHPEPSSAPSPTGSLNGSATPSRG
ncbi:metallophosphoesterase [Spongiactinospora sp. TRM90649]|uniref:metallophosphoesterase family protein n=1 Tax=Spongiactinospora sp. TRM90649 TaxID=3031114 RepID=UPI0023F7ABD5|nr:metallophosphoesterase [Spongiactinospora sp. TRM90649]MDF5754506.1 metallophosphoesterase [Spongiactinospora sp. TRM90649]